MKLAKLASSAPLPDSDISEYVPESYWSCDVNNSIFVFNLVEWLKVREKRRFRNEFCDILVSYLSMLVGWLVLSAAKRYLK